MKQPKKKDTYSYYIVFSSDEGIHACNLKFQDFIATYSDLRQIKELIEQRFNYHNVVITNWRELYEKKIVESDDRVLTK